MPWKAWLLSVVLVAMPLVAQAQSAPAALRGKSVTVSWSEVRSLRAVGEPNFRETRTPFSVSTYVSTGGRPFTRVSASPGRISGSADYVGAAGASQSGGVRQVRFHGNSLEMTTTMHSGGARRIMVEFGGGFSSCAARVITGKQVGGGVIRSKSLATGKPIEIRSVSVSGVNCSIRNGNVFGG
jgi:hypothetical protein